MAIQAIFGRQYNHCCHCFVRKYTYHIILLSALFLVHSVSHAFFYYFKHYQVDDGLSHNNVNCITQDRLGFMWVGTRTGLNRFDGYTFKSYTTGKGQKGSDYIKALCTDRNGIIWIGTASGIFKLDPVTEKISQVNILTNNNVRDILVDASNNLWILLAADQLHKYDQQRATLIDFNISVVAIDIDGQNNLWMASADSRLKKLHIPTNKITDFLPDKLPLRTNRSITKLMYTGETLLIGTRKGLFCMDARSGQYKPILLKNEKGTEVFVRDIFPSAKKETFYVATESGLYIYNLQNSEIIHLKKMPADPYSLNDNAIYSVYEDNREGVWLGTFFGGLNYFSKENNQFEKYYPVNTEGSISGNAVREICGDGKGNIWIGTEDAGINRLEKKTGRFYPVNHDNPLQGPSYPNIHGLLVHNNKLFVGPFFHGLEIMDLSTGRIIDRHARVPSNRNSGDIVMSIFKTSDNHILVGTTGSGLYEYKEAARQLAPVFHVPGDSYVYAIAEDHTRTIWTGSMAKGVFYYNPHTGESGNINFSQFSDTTRNAYIVQGIYEDQQYNIWLTTDGGGLFRINSQRQLVKRYTVKDGFPTNNLYRVLEDGQGNLWISTLKGLVCFNPGTEKVQTYTKANGLITDQFNFNSAYKDEDGKMYFGTVKGMVAFYPDKLTRNRVAPPTYITGFFVNQEIPGSSSSNDSRQAILFTDSITLTHLQTTFSIEFAALDYSSAQAVQYRYRMEGLDKDWTYLSANRRAYFTDLPAGNYTFVVQAESNLGYWTSPAKTIVIKILPPFWKSTPALILYVILALLIVGFGLYLHHQRLKKKNEHRIKLYEIEKEREIYHTKMNFFTNVAHEIQTPITLIKAPVEWALENLDDITIVKRNLELVDKHTDRLITLTAQLLDFRKMETNQFRLQYASTDVGAVITSSLASFKTLIEKRGLDCHVILPKETVEAFIDGEAFLKIVNNLLSNAVKYADSQVTVTLYKPIGQQQLFKVRITNDGAPLPADCRNKIFEPFYRASSHVHLPGTGIGLSLARSLTELHQGRLEYIENNALLHIFELTLPVFKDCHPNIAIENNHQHEDLLINN
ncbi:MAG: two-component regulator propeller domain-containing protein [Candidatus Pseudobacter hemicellulosilyticus]|uniref:histidine kinase n=1 Tax=Candidatus Pseudobacter hemicellulosilyticus TaxID=3121375 RepID=A0AAJ6BIH3_9BACT|nr:MAG: two-component regulator propeller domain-containing protein [Pseudobacter sp.]